MKKIWMLLYLIALVGCQKDTLTEDDAGTVFTTRVGSVFHISLFENATTGYRWHFTLEPDTQMIITQTSDVFEPTNTSRVGGGGTRVITYQATNPGTIIWRGFHARPWENNANKRIPAVEYTIKVNM